MKQLFLLRTFAASLLALVLAGDFSLAEEVFPTDNAIPAEINGAVLGDSGPLADAAVHVQLLSGSPHDMFSSAAQIVSKKIHLRQVYATGPDGTFTIKIPPEYRRNDILLTVELLHPGYLERTIGPVPLGDFNNRAIENDEPYWLHRQLARAAIRQCRLKRERRVVGRLERANGQPAVGARIVAATKYRAYSWKFHNANDYDFRDIVTVDEEGGFSLRTDAQFSLTATLPGEAPLLIKDFDRRIALPGSGDPLVLRFPDPIRLSCRVIDEHGDPLERVVVRATRNEPYNEADMPLSVSRAAVTDQQGRCELPPLPAGPYELRVVGSLADTEQDKEGSSDVANLPAVPLDAVFLPRPVEFISSEQPGELELRASPSVTVRVRVEFPDGPPDPARHSDVGIAGVFRGMPWTGVYKKADDEGSVHLLAPKGLHDARVKTGLARHRLGSQETWQIGQAAHLGQLETDRDGIQVSVPKYATLRVRLEISDALNDAIRRDGSRVRISAHHQRLGFRERSPTPEKLWLVGSSQSGNSRYRGTALPLEPIVLTVRLEKRGEEPVVLHEQEMILDPGEERVVSVPLQ